MFEQAELTMDGGSRGAAGRPGSCAAGHRVFGRGVAVQRGPVRSRVRRTGPVVSAFVRVISPRGGSWLGVSRTDAPGSD